ncbi:MAG: hypothetical protein Q7S04_02335 [Candidatus Moranbacteria bacterium]|nr:hypothetical protein [Candidatus Moranbacteria bacterium]
MPEEVLGGESREGGQESVFEKPEGTIEIFPVGEKEPVVESGKEQLEGKYNEILSKVSPGSSAPAVSDEDTTLDAKSIGATVDEESKIQKLLDLAATKGVAHAVNVARKLQDYYALDRMHDELVDKLYDGLLAKGLISKE